MTSEPILIVDDAPANLKLTQLVLAGAGYDVRTAKDAEEALDVVREFRPRLVLTDVRLPGMDGLELTRRLRTDPATHDAVILALTGCALESDEQKAMDAGFDGYIVKPYDTRKLPAIVRQHLTRSTGSRARANIAPVPPGAQIPVAELRRRFLSEGAAQSRKLVETLSSGFDTDGARATFRRWAGLGTTLGRPQIARLAQQAEALLEGPHPQASPQLREILDQLFRLFTERPPRRRETVLLPEPMIRQLSGKKLGLIGFDAGEARRLAEALSNAQAVAQALEGAETAPNSDALRSVDLVVFNLRHGAPPPEWIRRKNLASIEQPILFVGPRDLLLEHGISLKSGEHDFLIWPWDAEEAVMRACLAISRTGERQPRRTVPHLRPDVVIADDDPTTVALVKATLESHQMACRVAADGEQALEMIRANPPSAVILDLNMAALDGFEVLAALKRNEDTNEIPVVFLTSRQQETDIVRAFGLGADDYIVKPFSPMELAARLKRLVRKSVA
jgi:two-component system, cell cycle response regulator DivK